MVNGDLSGKVAVATAVFTAGTECLVRTATRATDDQGPSRCEDNAESMLGSMRKKKGLNNPLGHVTIFSAVAKLVIATGPLPPLDWCMVHAQGA